MGPSSWSWPTSLGFGLRIRCSMQSSEVVVEPVEPLGPEPLVQREPRLPRWRASSARVARCRHLPCWLRVMSDARSSTLRCREIAGRLMEKGAASSVTVASPAASRSTMPRRVASASAPKSRSRSSLVRSGATLNMMVKCSAASMPIGKTRIASGIRGRSWANADDSGLKPRAWPIRQVASEFWRQVPCRYQPGLMSMTMCVPRVVPLLTHSSRPWFASRAEK